MVERTENDVGATVVVLLLSFSLHHTMSSKRRKWSYKYVQCEFTCVIEVYVVSLKINCISFFYFRIVQ